MIFLSGPGGAGKTTTGAALAPMLATPFYDLDQLFSERHGNIGAFIETEGYNAYAYANVERCRELVRLDAAGVVALSSGFMVYEASVHPEYASLHDELAHCQHFFVLLPSLDIEVCVGETVRRQLSRPIGCKSAEREEEVLRARFQRYMDLPGQRVSTMRPVEEVATDILRRIAL
jgi:shikimate kinase